MMRDPFTALTFGTVILYLLIATMGYLIFFYLIRGAVKSALENVLERYKWPKEIRESANKQLEAIEKQNQILEKLLQSMNQESSNQMKEPPTGEANLNSYTSIREEDESVIKEKTAEDEWFRKMYGVERTGRAGMP